MLKVNGFKLQAWHEVELYPVSFASGKTEEKPVHVLTKLLTNVQVNTRHWVKQSKTIFFSPCQWCMEDSCCYGSDQGRTPIRADSLVMHSLAFPSHVTWLSCMISLLLLSSPGHQTRIRGHSENHMLLQLLNYWCNIYENAFWRITR